MLKGRRKMVKKARLAELFRAVFTYFIHLY